MRIQIEVMPKAKFLILQAASCSNLDDVEDTNKRLLAATMKVQNRDDKTFVAKIANVHPSNNTSLDPLQSCVLRLLMSVINSCGLYGKV